MEKLRVGHFTIFYEGLAEEVRGIVDEVFSRGVYEPRAMRDPRTIIDAGAHIGIATIWLAYRFPQALITAIEPLSENLALLERNVWENKLDARVKIVPVGLGSTWGEETFFADADDGWFSTAGPKGAWNGAQRSMQWKVMMRPLADFLASEVDLLKLDIEGAEALVLTTAESHLSKIREIVMEYHPRANNEKAHIESLLKRQGFVIDEDPAEKNGLQLIRAARRD